ncbi:MAG: DUF1735 domain-containing protein [Salinivirgaceae bacterium]|nr:DUF1735 domain-containing protein [Salinivirgaceae bacterium]
MKKYIFYTVQWLTVVILLTFSSCETIEIPGKPASEYEKIYMPTAVNYPNEKGLAFSDSVQLITYGAYFGSYDELGSDIEVQFEINADAAQSFNQQNNTDYPMLPEGLYTYSSASKIKKGEVSTEPLAIEINPGNELEESEKYILPVTVKSLSEGFVVNDELKTTYFVFSVKAED